MLADSRRFAAIDDAVEALATGIVVVGCEAVEGF